MLRWYMRRMALPCVWSSINALMDRSCPPSRQFLDQISQGKHDAVDKLRLLVEWQASTRGSYGCFWIRRARDDAAAWEVGEALAGRNHSGRRSKYAGQEVFRDAG
jgi:hypothetical protein